MTAEPPTNHVILVHGFKDNAAKMQRMARVLREKEGRTVWAPTLSPSWGQVTIEELARQLDEFISANISAGARLDLVGFSMGGIVVRFYLQRLGGLARADRFIAVAVPQRGLLLAHFYPAIFGRPGIPQLRRNSALLRDLDSDIETLARIKLTTLWTPLDLMILPASSSRMKIGREVKLWLPAHPLMVLSSSAIHAVAAALRD